MADKYKIFEVNKKVYILEESDNGATKLLRYNDKYKTYIEIEFKGEVNNTNNIVIESLSKQYIKRLIKELEEKR